MLVKEYFIKQGIKETQIEDFIRSSFPLGDYSRTELQRTPLGIKIIIYTNKPGRIIGRGGKNINEMTEALKKRFSLENPQLDVKSIESPDLDPKIVAKQIASALERNYNYKKIGNLTLKRILDAGAVGAEIIISGKLGGGKGVTGKFVDGYLKHCGEVAKQLVRTGFEVANTKPGKIGVKVKIMTEFVDITGEIRSKRYEDVEKKAYEEKEAEKKAAKEKAEEKAKEEKAEKKSTKAAKKKAEEKEGETKKEKPKKEAAKKAPRAAEKKTVKKAAPKEKKAKPAEKKEAKKPAKEKKAKK